MGTRHSVTSYRIILVYNNDVWCALVFEPYRSFHMVREMCLVKYNNFLIGKLYKGLYFRIVFYFAFHGLLVD